MGKKKAGGGGKGGGAPAPALKAGEYLDDVDPRTVLFSYGKIDRTFSGCGRKVEDTLASILSGELEPSALPVIACVEWTDRASGEVRRASLNNRRLWVLKQAADAGKLPGGVVRVRIKSPSECARLVAKGSRTFRVDRCRMDAVFVKDRPKPPPAPAEAPAEPPLDALEGLAVSDPPATS